jgi:hypothetical protein
MRDDYYTQAGFNVMLSEESLASLNAEREAAMYFSGIDPITPRGGGIMSQIRQANTQIYNSTLTAREIEEVLRILSGDEYKANSMMLNKTNIPGLTKFKVSKDDR